MYKNEFSQSPKSYIVIMYNHLFFSFLFFFIFFQYLSFNYLCTIGRVAINLILIRESEESKPN